MTAQGSRGTSKAGQPTWWASWAVRSGSLPLPSEHRWRYRQEFLAELLAYERLEVGPGGGIQAGAAAVQEGVGLPHGDE
jgi:hypothetical protein